MVMWEANLRDLSVGVWEEMRSSDVHSLGRMKHLIWYTQKTWVYVKPKGTFWSEDTSGDFLDGLVVKNLPCSVGDAGLIPGQGKKIPHALRQHGAQEGGPLEYDCLDFYLVGDWILEQKGQDKNWI